MGQSDSPIHPTIDLQKYEEERNKGSSPFRVEPS